MQSSTLCQQIADAFALEPHLDAASINVAFDGETVTLSGHADSLTAQLAAENIVRQVAGQVAGEVAGEAAGACVIVNLIKIEPRIQAEHVRRRIEDALRQAAEESAGALRIEVQGNRVTLEGKVHNMQERQAIRHAAATTPGVSSVNDRLSVVP